ncbi:MAG: hypothetical protein KZQ89_15440 [Candidatus Thiodiazotropha sp. (ex Lucinoma kastoroae)]|nr:hypothetical protein [Candidatus Thiodiazotropha sp. (ex Lucinoma kastoroae)]
MHITTDGKQTVYLEDIPVGRLINEGADQVFYVPGDGGFNQRLLPLNGLRLSRNGKVRMLNAVLTLRNLLESGFRADQ